METKAIGGLPGWVGSQAVAETGQRSMYNARAALGLSPSGWMSEMAGKSMGNKLTIGNLNFIGQNYGYSHANQDLSPTGQAMGSLSPDTFGGILCTQIAVYAVMGDELTINMVGNHTNRLEVTIEGAGTMAVGRSDFYDNQSEFKYPWGSIYSWFQARNGQVVNVSLRFI
ncbi:MAG: hypothetical protein ACRCR2_02255 [Fusobacteriaceae bacterium]